jgi:formate dehydrogenase major subunit
MTEHSKSFGKAQKVFGKKPPGSSGYGLSNLFVGGVPKDDAVLADSCDENKRNTSVKKVPTICPFCGVGCGFIATVEDGKIINMEGDPDNPFNKGTACSKGMALRQLSAENPQRLSKVHYRAKGDKVWQEKSWDWAIAKIARRIKETRDSTFIEKDAGGRIVNRTTGIAHMGCAPLNTEESYLISKMERALGVVYMDHVVRL